MHFRRNLKFNSAFSFHSHYFQSHTVTLPLALLFSKIHTWRKRLQRHTPTFKHKSCQNGRLSRGFHEESRLMGYEALSVNKQLLSFQTRSLPQSSYPKDLTFHINSNSEREVNINKTTYLAATTSPSSWSMSRNIWFSYSNIPAKVFWTLLLQTI